MDERTSVLLIEALTKIWSKIRERHPAVPGVVLLAAPAARGHLNVLGHFAALRWSPRHENHSCLHEVVVVAEHLNRPATEILETLLHEAAHAANFEQGIHDCSVSQYHNRYFRDAALELGLRVDRVPHYGYALTTLASGTAVTYAAEVHVLSEALVHRLNPEISRKGPGTSPPTGGDDDGDDETPAKDRSRSRKATCACPFIIRVSKKTVEETVIRCDTCGEPFRLG